ncbi:ArnT family glycosyltransferase [Methylomagnum sp.]
MRQFLLGLGQTPAVSYLIPVGYILLSVWVVFIHYHLAETVFGASLAASDPPAHFTSGVMVYDYLRDALGSHPIRFAESFYVRYPKVAIGHWPPVYYGVQAAWYEVFGPTVDSALALSAVIAAALAGLLFRRLRPVYGADVTAGAVLVFLALPWIQRTAWAVMSDLLTGLLVFLALLAFSDLLENVRSNRAAVRFAGWSILAILAKGTAWALGPFALLAPILARRMGCFKAWRYWAADAAIVALAAPFYLLMRQSQMGYPAEAVAVAAAGKAFNWMKHLAPLQSLPNLAPPLVWAVAAVGLGSCVWARWRRNDPALCTTDGLVAGAWVLAQAAFLFVLPLTREPRALVPALAPLALLVARAMGRASGAGGWRWTPVLPILLSGLAVFSAEEVCLSRVDGYREAARAIPYPPEGALVMMASDPAGEGAFIVERLMADDRRAGVVLRGGQWLAESDWMGARRRPLFDSAEQVRQALKDLPVRYVVIDGSAGDSPDQRLLREAVEGDPAAFRLFGRFPVLDSLGVRAGDIRIYESPAAGARHPEAVRVRLGMERGGRVLEYRWP